MEVFSGGGRVGKTQLAAALTHDAAHDRVDLVLWADATRLDQVLGTYANAAALVRVPGAAGQDVEADARAFVNWAATTSRSWLMIFDDVTEPAELRGWWPPVGAQVDGGGQASGGSGERGVRHRAVITTRLKGADISGGGRRVLDVSTCTPAESAAFLHERLALADTEHLLDEAVDEIGAVLGHLPLALGYAAAWMINQDRPCTAYVAHFHDQKQKRDLGSGHPDTLRARAHLADSYRHTGRIDAITIAEQVLADREHVLGLQHPDTLTARGSLAHSYWTAGRTQEAMALEEQVLVDRERILGPQHPHTLTARNNLAISYRTAGRRDEAVEQMERTTELSQQFLGSEHPHTRDRRETLRRWQEEDRSLPQPPERQ
ncbi:tetratricopeptide repeat protein [Streptomyces sp. NPDC047071]|uniref:tetratricopeptide repeat protein n=1 Tax=Streptomyces sp. NPDC047071 TaxID=3154808 RepID=UPI003451E588